MMEYLFLDLDDTILDFHKAERIALSKTLRDFGLEPTETVLSRYHDINIWHWQQLEKGLMTRDQVLEGRFRALFSELWDGVTPLRLLGVTLNDLCRILDCRVEDILVYSDDDAEPVQRAEM